jgi:hypothetical protein
VDVPLGINGSTYIRIDNTGNDDRDTVVTFYLKAKSGGNYEQWYTTGAAAVTFTSVKSTVRVYGPFEGFPAMLGGQLKIAGSGGAVANNKNTKVQVWEV